MVLGHLEEKQTLLNVEYFIKSQNQEFDADASAFEILIKCGSKNRTDFPVFSEISTYGFSPLLFFDLIALMEKKKNTALAKTHPSAMERKMSLLNYFSSNSISFETKTSNTYNFIQNIFSAFYFDGKIARWSAT